MCRAAKTLQHNVFEIIKLHLADTFIHSGLQRFNYTPTAASTRAVTSYSIFEYDVTNPYAIIYKSKRCCCEAHLLQSMIRLFGFYSLFYCLPSQSFAGALIKRIIHPDLKMDNARSSQPALVSPASEWGPQVIPADSITLGWWRDWGCQYIDAQIPVCARHVCALPNACSPPYVK